MMSDDQYDLEMANGAEAAAIAYERLWDDLKTATGRYLGCAPRNFQSTFFAILNQIERDNPMK